MLEFLATDYDLTWSAVRHSATIPGAILIINGDIGQVQFAGAE